MIKQSNREIQVKEKALARQKPALGHWLIALTLLLLLAILVTSCGGSASTTTTATTAGATSGTTAGTTGAGTTTETTAATEGTDKVFTVEELAQYDGLEGRKAYIAVEGIVYDVTLVAQWGAKLHAGKFQAGKDYTEEIKNAPHGLDKLLVAVKVGVLKTD